MWKDSIRNNVVIFQPNILRIVGFYVRHSAFMLIVLRTLIWHILEMEKNSEIKLPLTMTLYGDN